MGEDQIVFCGAYRDFSYGVKYDVTGAGQAEVARILTSISSKIEPASFRFAGINEKAIGEKVAGKISGKGIPAVYGFLESNPPKELKTALEKTIPDPLLMPAAETCLLNALLSAAGVGFKAAPEAPERKPSAEKPDDVIAFMGKYGQWVAIKKLGLDSVKDYEVSGILAGINHTLVNKAFDFSGAKKDDALVASVTAGRRKSFGNVGMCLRELEGKLSGDAGDAYAVCKTLEALGYRPYASPGMLTDMYPDIKPPKQRGRKPKG